MVSGGHKKNGWGGRLRAAELPRITVGELVESNESRCQLSPQCCHKLQTPTWSGDTLWTGAQLVAEPQQAPPPPGWNGAVHATGVGKVWWVPEIKTLNHKPGEHRVLTEMGETRVINCSSVRAH